MNYLNDVLRESLLYELEYALNPTYLIEVEQAGNANAYRQYLGNCMWEIHASLALDKPWWTTLEKITVLWETAPYYN